MRRIEETISSTKQTLETQRETVENTSPIYLPKRLTLLTLANRIGVSLDEVLKTYPRVNGHEVGYARTQVAYAVAKDIATILGKETKKILYPRLHESKNYVFPDMHLHDVRHEFANHNPRFSLIDTTHYAIHYLKGLSSDVQENNEVTLEELYPQKSEATSKKRHLHDQRNAHIEHMSKKLGISQEEFVNTMKKGYSKLNLEGSFDLIDASDVLEYIVDGQHDKDRYPETYKMLKKRYGDKTELMIYILSATSIRSTLESNVAKALDAFEIINQEGEQEFLKFMDGICIQLKQIKSRMNDAQEFVGGHPLSGRKVVSFSNGMLGDKNVVVVDRRLQRAFKIDNQTSPSTREYDQVENLVRTIAKEIGREPRQVSAAIRCSIRRKYFKDQKDYGVALMQQERKRTNRKLKKEYMNSISTLFPANSD